MEDTRFILVSVGLAFSLFVAMLAFLELGRRIGVSWERTRGHEARAGVGVVDGSVYGLLALLIGFSFSGAAGRFDQRRALVGAEATAASTAWRRIQLLPDSLQPPVQDALRRYLDELIAFYTETWDPRRGLAAPPELAAAEDIVWHRSVAACKAPGGEPARMLLLPALNEVFDAVDRELLARHVHPPIVIFLMLGVAALATALFAGYGMAASSSRNWVYIIGIAATVSMSTYVIIELEYPRVGLLRVNPIDRLLIDARAKMK